MSTDFGIFEPVFKSSHGYLALLNLGADDAQDSVALVSQCCKATPDPIPDICRLLADSNWRPHLVAAVASLLLPPHPELIKQLWHRFDCGSWAVPQIGATLSLLDPDFVSQARTRLEALCPVDTSELFGMSPAERHSAAGPEGVVHRSAKAAKSLSWLVGKIASPHPWLEHLKGSEDFQALITQDMDASDRITEKWHDRIVSIMKDMPR